MNLKDKVAQLFCEIAEAEKKVSDLSEDLEENAIYRELNWYQMQAFDKRQEVDSLLRGSEEDFSYEGNGYLAKKHTGSRKSIDWKMEQIEKMPWGSACITKAVNEKVFDALVKGKVVENPDEFRTVTTKEFPVVTIKKIKEEPCSTIQ